MKPLITVLFLLCFSSAARPQNYRSLRNNMVSNQLEARDISDRATLNAMRKVERHLFVPTLYRQYAYDDTALPIGFGQSISQPYIVATMTQLIKPKPTDRVLEVGTGSGYQAAVLAAIVKQVYTIEIIKELGEQSKKLLAKLGYKNVQVIIGDGYKGFKEKAPFDAIIVTAAVENIPAPLVAQLKEGGKMVIPVGAPQSLQTLLLIEKRKGEIKTRSVTQVLFVPFTRPKK